MKRDQMKVALLAIVVTLVVVLIVQNTEVVQTRVYFWVLPLPRFLLLGMMLVLGGVVGYVLGRKRTRGEAEAVAAPPPNPTASPPSAAPPSTPPPSDHRPAPGSGER